MKGGLGDGPASEIKRSRAIAASLADQAEEIAGAMERAAALHDAIAATAGHPLQAGAAAHAAAERRLAAQERRAAAWLRRVAAGEHRGGSAAPVAGGLFGS